MSAPVYMSTRPSLPAWYLRQDCSEYLLARLRFGDTVHETVSFAGILAYPYEVLHLFSIFFGSTDGSEPDEACEQIEKAA